ncbi:PP2C family protein-serine/threonine phosphatase [Zymomonas mobilis]|uniref:PP2C family protein-serine/threonine phosphatase n=1 Tax=Zymomonas mobilis TaxID=542 RepID=UPI0039ECAFDB
MIERIQNRLARALEAQGSGNATRTHSGVAIGSSVGQVRKRNEDCCLVARVSYAHGGHTNFTIAMVCDGLGGMSQGREAAILAASSFTAYLFSTPLIGWKERLSKAIAFANKQIYQRLHGAGGTTLSAVISFNDRAIFCHVGDSRVYGVMPDHVVEQLSRDDTINALLKRQEGQGEAPKDSRLLQFVGMGEEMEVQIAPVPRHCRSVLLTSDGAHDVPHSIFQRVVSAAAGGSDLVRKLLMLSDMTGGRDNASAIFFPIGSGAELYDERGDNELLAILPNDTLSIHITGPDAWERSEHIRNAPPNYQPIKQIEERSASKKIAAPEQATNNEPEIKPSASKAKARTSKTHKIKWRVITRKAEAAAQLQLDGLHNEVDVQFSTPATPPEEDKQ